MRKMRVIAVVLAVLTLSEAAPALAVDALEGGKPRHKVKEIGELDADAPKETGGKIQFIPTGKARKQLRSEKRKERLARKAELRKQRKEEHARLRSLRHGQRAEKKAHKVRVHKEHKAKVHKVKAHKVRTHRSHGAKHVGGKHHAGRKHKKR